MKSFRDIFDLRHKKSFRLGLLLVSSVLIISATVLVYGRMVYEKPLNAGNAGSGSTAPTGISFSPATILILALSASVISLSLFGLLREVRKQIGKVSDTEESSPTVLDSVRVGEEAEEASGKEDELSELSSSSE
jgi:hypothetical protein